MEILPVLIVLFSIASCALAAPAGGLMRLDQATQDDLQEAKHPPNPLMTKLRELIAARIEDSSGLNEVHMEGYVRALLDIAVSNDLVVSGLRDSIVNTFTSPKLKGAEQLERDLKSPSGGSQPLMHFKSKVLIALRADPKTSSLRRRLAAVAYALVEYLFSGKQLQQRVAMTLLELEPLACTEELIDC